MHQRPNTDSCPNTIDEPDTVCLRHLQWCSPIAAAATRLTKKAVHLVHTLPEQVVAHLLERAARQGCLQVSVVHYVGQVYVSLLKPRAHGVRTGELVRSPPYVEDPSSRDI